MISPRRTEPRRATIGVPGRLLVAAALIGLAALPAAQASPVRAVTGAPPEQVVALDGRAVNAIVGDVDGEGVRELVRVVPWETNPTQLAVDVARGTADGVALLPQVALRRESTPDDRDVVGRGDPDPDGMFPVLQGDPVRLLAWNDGARERVLVAALGVQLFGACCLTLWDVTLNAFGVPELSLLAETHGSADTVTAIDLDGDGADEIAVSKPNDTVEVYRWDGSGFADTGVSFPLPPSASPLVDVGDTDGLPGSELACVGESPLDDQPAVLERLAIDRDLTARTDRAEVPFPGIPVGIPGEDRARIAVVSATDGTALVDMPLGGEPTSITTSTRRGVPLGVLGRGDDARLLLLRDGSIVDVLDGALASRQGFHGSPSAAVFLGSELPPFVGELPGGLPSGGPAILFRGAMAEPPDPTSLRSTILVEHRVAVLPGKMPIGVFGPGGAWMGIGDSSALPVARRVGILARTASGRGVAVVAAATSEVLTTEADAGDLRPTLVNARRLDTQPARPIVAAAGPFQIDISAPPGSRAIVATVNPFVASSSLANADSRATLRVSTALDTKVDARFAARVLVATPGGHGYGATWEVRILREAPPLRAEAERASFSAQVTVRGSTAADAEITVDGQRATVAPDGTFAVEVAAGLLPRDVEVVAADLLGNTARTRVSVVAFVDYRTLPWTPIVAVVTVLVAGFLYLRTPRPRPSDRADDASFEEIG
jgi:hypothetical protein